NALYAQVQTNYDNDTITLVRGHGYPDSAIRNGFDWKYDNSRYEYDIDCNNWNIYRSGNYSMLNCYPEFAILHNAQLIHMIQDKNPAYLYDDLDAWSKHPNNSNAIAKLLYNYGVHGTHIPHWVRIGAVLVINGEISQTDFSTMIKYLYLQNLLDRN
ncbi:MAG: hypothetical protein KGI05_09180, partial [Thaumarchaeota archaeon]|nr:hypothetical protein [Nitrososphaerota archaeon]